MTPYFSENPPDDEPVSDGGEFSIEIDDMVLEAAMAAVDKRMKPKHHQEPEPDVPDLAGPLDLNELLAVEDELALEIDDNDFDLKDALGPAPTQVAEVRIRAMEAETERDELKDRMLDLSKAKRDIEAKLDRLNERASRARASTRNAVEAQAAAENRAKRLKNALEKQQSDIEKLLERRKKDTRTQYSKGRSDAVLPLIEVLDSLELALSHTDHDPTKIIDGVSLAVQQFHAALKRIGVKPVVAEPGGEFNPNHHEAITRESSDTIKPGHIVEVVSSGFTLDGRLIRAARVSVATE